jgi:hypothetical protein
MTKKVRKARTAPAKITNTGLYPSGFRDFGREFGPKVQAISLQPPTSGFIRKRGSSGWYNGRIDPSAALWLNEVLARSSGDRKWGLVLGGSLVAVWAAVNFGGNVALIDSSPEYLQFIRQQTAPENQSNLRTELVPDHFYESKMKDARVDYILCTGTFAGLNPEQCEATVKKMFAVAKEGCQIFVEVFSYCSSRFDFDGFVQDFEAREAAGDEFPGYGIDVSEATRGVIAGVLNPFNPKILRRLFENVGFEVTHCDYEIKPYKSWINRGDDQRQFVTLTAIKPKRK